MSKVADIISSFSDLSVAELEELDDVVRAGAADIPEEHVASLVAATNLADLARTAKAQPSRIRRMAALQGRPTPSPEAAPERGRNALVASGNLAGVPAGTPIEDRHEFAERLAETLRAMPRDAPSRGTVIVASARWEYPLDRQLSPDQERNQRILDAVTHPSALVASGGVCAPVNVDYSVPGWATADRPIQAGLPAFQADRGGLTFIPPLTVAQLAAASTVWTEATDASPGAATKPVLQLSCASPTTVLLDAIPTRIGVGNLAARFSPEQVAAAVDLSIAASARIAENNLLDKLAAACVADVTAAVVLGATRDLLTTVSQAAAGMRSTHRLASSVVLRGSNRMKGYVMLCRSTRHGETSCQ